MDKIEPLAIAQPVARTLESTKKKTLKQAHVASSA
jgi:hypothetical protein